MPNTGGKVQVSAQALRQLDEALGFVAARSPQAAAAIAGRLEIMLDLLASHPHVGRKTWVAEVRRLWLTPYPYLIDYVVRDDVVVVQRFRHAARRPLS